MISLLKSRNISKNVIITIFVLIPILSSMISFVHMISFLSLGNHNWVSIAMAITYELGSISFLLAIVIMDKLKKSYVWSVFYIILITQIFGNVYFTYDYIKTKLVDNSKYINHFSQIIDTSIGFISNPLEPNTHIFLLSIIIGVPIPIISIFISKSLQGYFVDTNIDGDEPIPEILEDADDADTVMKLGKINKSKGLIINNP